MEFLEASTTTWPDGVYYYQVQAGEDLTSGKVIKGKLRLIFL